MVTTLKERIVDAESKGELGEGPFPAVKLTLQHVLGVLKAEVWPDSSPEIDTIEEMLHSLDDPDAP